jgi:predicted TIM-barrel fold metal-dependent hydrolase
MSTRRQLLIGSVAAGVTTLLRRSSDAFAKASQPSTPVNFQVPTGACDTHTHIFGDPRRFPYSDSRAYTPETASIEEMRALHRSLGIDRVVIVQASVYGTDNSCMLDALKQFGPVARGIAVIDDKIPESTLDAMDRAGVRGIRINLETVGQTDPAVAQRRFQAAVERIKNRKWQIVIYTRLAVIEAIKDQVAASPVTVVFDHFGGANAALGTEQPGFGTLLGLVRTGKVYVKISAPYRSSTHTPDYLDVAPLAKALIEANPQRILWGSDWPHPRVAAAGQKGTDFIPFSHVDDGQILNLLPVWVPDSTLRKRILVENPARLYRF